MPITLQQLLLILPNAGPRVGIFLPALNRAMARFKIDSLVRQSAFIAQVGHETGQLKALVESLNYDAKGLASTWPSRYRAADGAPNTKAFGLSRKPEAIANDTYAGRNGNTQAGDGWKFRGRGGLQITGRAGYLAMGKTLDLPLIEQPELLEQPEWAMMSSAAWWSANGLNDLADAGRIQDIGSLINTGKVGRVPHGADNRLALYKQALKVLA